MILNSGGQFEGVWIDKKNGRGKYTSPNGEVIEGVYQDDKLVTAVARPDTPLGSAIGKYCICMYMYMSSFSFSPLSLSLSSLPLSLR